jgi:hypothetical protein
MEEVRDLFQSEKSFHVVLNEVGVALVKRRRPGQARNHNDKLISGTTCGAVMD